MQKILAMILMLLVVCQSAIAAPTSAANARLLYSGTNLTTSAYVQMFGSLLRSIKAVSVYNSGANPIIIAVGGSGVELNQIMVPPLTAGASVPVFPLVVSQGQRISVIASTGTISSGELEINVFYN